MSFWLATQLQFEKCYKRMVVNVKMFSVTSVEPCFLVDQPYKAILGEFLVLTKWIIVPNLTLRSWEAMLFDNSLICIRIEMVLISVKEEF